MPATESIPFLSDPARRGHQLTNQTTKIDRAIENDVAVTSRRVSRMHAQVQRQGQSVILADLGSTNGTSFDGERVLAPVELRDGDSISIGGVVLTYHDPESTYLESPFRAGG
jgi:adenylate cyclase